MWLTLFVRRVVVVCCILLLLLVGCAPEKETVAPATRRAVEATAVTSPVTATATATAALATATAAAPTAATPAPTLAPTPALIPSATADPLVLSPENAATITQIAQFGKGTIDAISWSPDSATFAVAGSAGIHLYDAATLQEVGAFDAGEEGYIADARFSPQGDILALLRCSQACGVELWQTASGRLIRSLAYVDQLPAFTPDGQTIIFVQSVDYGTPALVWQDVHTGETQRTVQLELADCCSYTLSPSGDMLAENDFPANATRLWDTASGQVRHTIAVSSTVAFSPQGDLLASVNTNGVQLWDVKSGQPLRVLEGATGPIVFSPDGRILAIGTRDRTLQLWDTATGQLRHVLTNNNGDSLAFSPDGRQLAVVGGSMGWGGSKVLFYDTETGQLLRTLAGYNFTGGIAFTPDGNSLIVVGGNEAQTWDVHSGQLRQTQASDIPIRSIAFSPDGKLMAWGGGEYGYGGVVADDQYIIQMWDVATGQPFYTLQEPGDVVYQVRFSPDGQFLATWSGGEGVVKLRQASTGELLFSRPASNVVFHPHGRLFATGVGQIYAEGDVGLQLWDMDTFELVRSVEGLQLPVTFTADGNIVASNDTGTTGIWDIDTGELLLPFTGGDAGMGYYPSVAALSPDGRILALGNQLWDMSTGQFLWTSDQGAAVAFRPDGRLLATVNGDGTLSLWGLPSNTAGAEGEAPAAGDSAVPAEVASS